MVDALTILSVVGARPNFMKLAPFCRAIEAFRQSTPARDVRHVIVHTGQHYDETLSGAFFAELGIPAPDCNLGIGSGDHGDQIGRTMVAFEPVLLGHAPRWVVVIGDVNATLACSVVARKHQVDVAHIEAGLRSRDWTMPEEINRVVTDRVSTLLFTPDRIADANLAAEGTPASAICRVGNIMIDTLVHERPAAERVDLADALRRSLLSDGARPLAPRSESFAALTLHRPSNVDGGAELTRLVEVIEALGGEMPIVFPVHPRTRHRLEDAGLWGRLARHPRLLLTEPLAYREMLSLTLAARIVLTDSGGIQEEAAFLGKPCLTLRANTERPITLVEHGGTNRLVGNDPAAIADGFRRALAASGPAAAPPELWDGHTAERILAELITRA